MELYEVANDVSSEISFQILLVMIYGIFRSFLQVQFIVFKMYLNQHRIWDQRIGKYLLKLKIRNLLMVLKVKSKNRNPLNAHVEFVGRLDQS